MTTGTISPASSLFCVRALNCLQNSMMLTCAWPSAGPTGGAGVALAASICSLTEPVTFFAISIYLPVCVAPSPSLGFSAWRRCLAHADYLWWPISSIFLAEVGGVVQPKHAIRGTPGARLTQNLFHLTELQFHRSGAAEDGDHHLQGLAVLIDLVHHAGEGGKRAFGDAHRLVLFILDLELGLLFAVGDAVNNLLHLGVGERRGLLAGAHESRDPRGGLHHVPDFVVHVHFDQNVAGIEHALAGVLLVVANLGDGLGGDQDLADAVFESEGPDARLQRLLHLALEPRVGMDDVPLHPGISRCLRGFRRLRCRRRADLHRGP